MADKKITELTELGSGLIASGDYFVVVDISDTTGASSGTTKKLDADNIADQVATAFGKTLMDDGNAAAFMTTLGMSAFGQTLIDDAAATNVLTSLGLDTDLLTLSLPAALTISAFGITWMDDATIAAIRTTLGMESNWNYEGDVVTTSGTAVTLATGISEATELEIFLNKVSTNTDSEPPVVQFGTGAGPTWKTAGYKTCTGTISGAVQNLGGKTSGFFIADETTYLSATNAAAIGVMSFHRFGVDADSDFWIGYYTLAGDDVYMSYGYGEVDMGADLTAVRLKSADGVATFDLGSAEVRWR